MTHSTRVGFVGVGLMGHGLALNIAKAGYPLTFLEHPGNRPVGDLLDMGAESTGDIMEIARSNDVVLMCVTGSEQVEQVVLGEPGLLAGLEAGQCVVDCSTVEPRVTRRIAADIADRGASFLDAPLTRTPREAELGRVNVMVGGDSADLERVRPLLDTFAENVYHAGPVGTGVTLKLLHNFISLGNCVLLAEAVICARTADVDIRTFLEVLTTGGGDSTALKRLTPFIADGDAGGLRFSIANGAKDTAYYRSLAEDLGVPAVAAGAIQAVFTRMRDEGYDQRSVPELIDLMSARW